MAFVWHVYMRVKEFVYTNPYRENVTDYSTQAFIHWVQTMQWKAKNKQREDATQKGNKVTASLLVHSTASAYKTHCIYHAVAIALQQPTTWLTLCTMHINIRYYTLPKPVLSTTLPCTQTNKKQNGTRCMVWKCCAVADLGFWGSSVHVTDRIKHVH